MLCNFFYNLNSDAIIISNGMVAWRFVKGASICLQTSGWVAGLGFVIMEDVNVDIPTILTRFLKLFCGEELCDRLKLQFHKRD